MTNPLPHVPLYDSEPYDENQLPQDVVNQMPYIDTKQILDNDSQTLVTEAESIARSYNQKSVQSIHLLYACVENDHISSKLSKLGVKTTKITRLLSTHITQGEILPRTFSGEALPLSKEVEEVLTDSLGEDLTMRDRLVTPLNIFVTLIQKDYDVISNVLRQAGVDIGKLVGSLDSP